jgi:hypothetical protein
MTTVYVTNKWDKPITFSFEYVWYTFPVGETVEVPLEAARHIFGYQHEDKEPFMAQLSIIKTKAEVPDGLKALQKILITDQPPKKGHAISPVVEKVPLPSVKGVEGKFNIAA